jgi:hypothetical protein
VNEVIVFMKDGVLNRVTPYYAGGFTVQSEMKAVPQGAAHLITDGSKMPHKLLRNAWKIAGSKVGVDIEKGKLVCHSKRRLQRDEALKANTAILTKMGAGIPLSPYENAATAASENAAYMVIDDAAQVSINESTTANQLVAVLNTLGIE